MENEVGKGLIETLKQFIAPYEEMLHGHQF